MVQAGAGAVKVVVGQSGRTAGQWIGVGDFRYHQSDAAGGQIELREER